jgi:hypothetical protein
VFAVQPAYFISISFPRMVLEHTEQWALEVLKAGAEEGPVTVFVKEE